MANFEDRRKLIELIEKHTKVKDTTTSAIGDNAWKKLKEILKDNNENVKSFFELLLVQLKSKNAQTRYLTLMLVDYIFSRSKYFRELFVRDMKQFFDLAVGIDTEKPLPNEPAGWAPMLRDKSLDLIEKWNTNFGQLYKQLRNGYNYLKFTRKMKFPDVQGNERRRQEEEQARQERTQRILQLKFDKIQKELDERLPEIDQNLQLMENSFTILVPNLEEGGQDSSEATGSADATFDEIVQDHGLGSTTYEITISVDKNLSVKKEDNAALIDTLQDCLKILDRQMRIVKDWSRVLMKLRSSVQANHDLQETLLKKVIDIQNKMKVAQSKCEELHISEAIANRSIAQEQDDENEFEDSAVYDDGEGNQMVLVPHKEGYEETHEEDPELDFLNSSRSYTTTTTTTTTPTKKPEEFTLTDALMSDIYPSRTPTKPTPPKSTKPSPSSNNNNNNNNNNEEDDINNSTSTSSSLEVQENESEENSYVPHWLRKDKSEVSTSQEIKDDETRDEMLQRAPKIKNEPFLYFWGKTEVDLNTGLECNHRFLGSSKSDTVVSTDKLDMYMRTTFYEAKPVDHKPCKAPLKNGKLCTRKDAKFCPFHGPIIPRDDEGRPISESLDQSRTEEDDIQIPLFGKGVETVQLEGARKKRKSEQGLRERMKDKTTPKKQSRISM